MFNLLGILAADRIIDYFKLDARLPSAARYFSLRKQSKNKLLFKILF